MSKKKENKVKKVSSQAAFDNLIESTKNPYLDIIDKGEQNHHRFIDTGSYLLNAQISGSIYGGLQMGKMLVLAGETTTGKSYILLKIIKLFLKDNPDARVVLFETEGALGKEPKKELIERGVVTKEESHRITVLLVRTVEKLIFEANKILEGYLQIPLKARFPMLMGVDSVSQLCTEWELRNIAEGELKEDMGRTAKIVKRFYRAVDLPSTIADVPVITTAHLYVDPSKSSARYIKKVMGGGNGGYYTADTIFYFSKYKESEEGSQTGSIITSRAQKCRSAVEGSVIELKVTHKKGLNRYYGLLDIAIEAGIVKIKKKRCHFGSSEKGYPQTTINKNGKRFFTPEIREKIDEYCMEKFSYKADDSDDSLEDLKEEKPKKVKKKIQIDMQELD